MRWREIAALNAGRAMADGAIFDTDNPLQLGWELALHADATGAIPNPTDLVADTGAQQVVVTPGDTLWEIAETHTSDSDNWDESPSPPIPSHGPTAGTSPTQT